MAEITSRRTGELLRKLFEIVMAHQEGMRAKDALAALADSVTLTTYEQGYYNAGARRFEKFVRFATIDTVKAGWLVKAKGTWTITDAGRNAHRTLSDPEAFYREATRLYRQWKASQPDDVAAEPASTPAETASEERDVVLTFEEAEEQAWNEVERFLRQMPPYEFQELVGELLRGMVCLRSEYVTP